MDGIALVEDSSQALMDMDGIKKASCCIGTSSMFPIMNSYEGGILQSETYLMPFQYETLLDTVD